jgi:hypothetical protein
MHIISYVVCNGIEVMKVVLVAWRAHAATKKMNARKMRSL